MENAGPIIAIAAAIIIPIILLLTKKAVGVRHQRVTDERQAEARELEIKVRMASGLGVVNDFNDLARVYVELGRLEDAENAMRKAVSITESELGQMDPTLVPVLENYANVLDKMNRGVEANKVRQRARDLASKRR
ncbi:MAG: tetratricopeptide repeat protein [Candidatus Melainabacteria bacterium]|nr:tetratricopeptide repeat protein [Candidatus Melainabacteria bacterium]